MYAKVYKLYSFLRLLLRPFRSLYLYAYVYAVFYGDDVRQAVHGGGTHKALFGLKCSAILAIMEYPLHS